MTRRIYISAFFIALGLVQSTPWAAGQDPDPAVMPPPNHLAAADPPKPDAVLSVAPAAPAEQAPSEAERIARLERSIESDDKRLLGLKASLTSPDGEYARAEASFRELDAQRAARQQKLAEAEQSGSSENWARLKQDDEGLEKKWTLAKERFDLAIAERKASQESVVTLERKLQGDRESLAKLRGVAAAPPAPPAAPPVAPATASPASAIATAPAQPSIAESAAALASTTMPVEAVPAATESPDKTLADNMALPKLTIAPAVSKRLAAEINLAKENAKQSIDAATDAEATASAITERILILQKDIEQQRDLRETARKKLDNADQTLKNLNEELFQKLMKGEDISPLRTQIRETTARLWESRETSREASTHLDDLQSTLALLQAEQITATNDARAKREAALIAEATVQDLQNPLTLRNVLQWTLDHGPRIVVILLALSSFLWLSRVCETRLVSLIARRGRRGSREDRENRAKTLLGVFNNVSNLLVVGGGIVMLLDEIGIPIMPIIGGAAVFGLAVAFGAQSLIKDYFTGFMVLLEQQYLINDVVKIGEVTGQVERISLRMTVLRDMEGRVHFVPHGQITTVTNLTHGWSRAVFEIGVAYKERVDDVMEVLKKLSAELRQEDAYRFLILNEPVMLGVDALADSAVIIKFYIQTRPLQQWIVKREMLRRIKNEFDRLGIEIPFPHVTMYRGTATASQSSSEEDGEHWGRRDVA